MYMLHTLLETGQEYAAHLHLKWYTVFFRHTPKMRFSSCYNKWSVGYFGLKLNRHILGTPKINITSCKKGHNRCPLKTIACEQSALFDEYSMMQEQWIKPIMNQTSNQIKQHFLTIVLRWSLQQNCGERIVEKSADLNELHVYGSKVYGNYILC